MKCEIEDAPTVEPDEIEYLHDLICAIGSITYGKERWFDNNDGTWYDRNECDNVPLSKIIDRVIDAVREAEEYY